MHERSNFWHIANSQLFLTVAQTITVKGTVVDALNEPLIGVSILVQGTNNGATTDFDGNYELSNVPAEGILVFSYIGMKTQTIAVNGQSTINITMRDNTELLEEVIVVGYGTQKKSSLTGSVASISSKELRKQVTSNVASALQGRTPGVQILQKSGEAGSDVSILIRGAGSFGSTEPLYLIDGAVSNNGLNSLNPQDIKSIEILKDGAAAAIYGSRAANGVVLITTKRGEKGDAIVELGGSYTYQTPSKKLNFMNAEQWRTYANMLADNSTAYERASQNVNPTNPDFSQDWQELYYQSAPMYNMNASISGGNDALTFNTSLGYLKQSGIIIKSGFEKYNARLNSSVKKGFFSITENLSIAYSKKQSAPENRIIEIPTIPVKNDLGQYISTPSSEGYTVDGSDIVNPLTEIYAQDSWSRLIDITGNVEFAFNLSKGLVYKLNLAGSYLNNHNYTHTPAYASYWNNDGTPDSRFSHPQNSLSEGRGEHFNYIVDNTLSYKNTFKDHYIDALLGTSWMSDYSRSMSVGSANADLGSPQITTFNGTGEIGSNELKSVLLSYFVRLNYDYANKYLLSLSLRSDKSSKFAEGHRTGYFPSISAGWNIHNESFFDVSWLSKLKFRGSYGELGANFINPYSFLSLAYGPVPAIFGSTRHLNGYLTRLAQSTLTWETSVSYNIGLELGFINNALTITTEYFVKKNNDLLAPLEALPSSGQTILWNNPNVPYFNTASVENKGFEVVTEYRKKWNDFNLGIMGNITFLKNNVIALGEGVKPIRGPLISSFFDDRPSITQPGMPIGTFWGYKVIGLSDSGNFLYEGADGTSKTIGEVNDKDKQVLGDPNPDFTYGININLGYKEWDLTAFFQGTHGNEIFAAEKYPFYFVSTNNHLVDALNSWSPSNTNTTIPIALVENFKGGNALPSSFYIEDGSYLRCQNLQLGYTLIPSKNNSFIKSARFYAGVQNLFTITKYPFYDPEVSSNTLFSRGIDNVTPAINARVFTTGFNITF